MREVKKEELMFSGTGAVFAFFLILGLLAAMVSASGCGGGGNTTVAPTPTVPATCDANADCDDDNVNTIDTCSNPGTESSTCINTVNRTLTVRVIAVNPVNGDVPVSGAGLDITYNGNEVNGIGGVIFAGTDSEGKSVIPNRGADTYTINVSSRDNSVPHFQNPAAPSFTLTATSTGTVWVEVRPRYDVQVMIRKEADHQPLLGATLNFNMEQYPVAQTADVELVNEYAVATAHDVLMGDYIVSIVNKDETTPIFTASETPDLNLAVYSNIAINSNAPIINVLATTCYTDADCETNAEGVDIMPTGMTVADCYNGEGTISAACRYQ